MESQICLGDAEFYHDALIRRIAAATLRRLRVTVINTQEALAMPQTRSQSMPESKPLLSIVVVIYKMTRQAKNTLLSLSTAYQRGVDVDDYEIIVVENRSSDMLGQQEAEAVASNIRYFEFDEVLPTPVNALNVAAQRANADALAMMIDGARLLSPGVVRLALDCVRQDVESLAVVPGYHIGREIQQEAVKTGYDTAAEIELMNSVQWPNDGYRLFDISCLSGSCRRGFFAPMSESNFLLLSRRLFESLGGFDSRFNSHGGGFANLDLYQRACEKNTGRLFNFFGEGTFHQLHGGATTGGVTGEERAQVMQALREQYRSIRQKDFSPLAVSFCYHGEVSTPAKRFLAHSAAAL